MRDIPFEELKIDRSFVRGAHASGTQGALFKASLGLAHQIGISAVAEGAEDRADWNFVRMAGCDMLQGYLIVRPMKPEALLDRAQAWRERFVAELQTTPDCPQCRRGGTAPGTTRR